MNTKRFVVELQQGDVLPLDNASGVQVASLEGSLWLTEEHGRGDVILKPGESYAVAAKGRTLVQALSAARVAVQSAGAPQLGFTPLPLAA